MGERVFRTKPGHHFTACPQCGNDRDFVARAEQVAEDCCEMWIICRQCGHDPTRAHPGHRLEDTWGGYDAATIYAAMLCREDALEEEAARLRSTRGEEHDDG